MIFQSGLNVVRNSNDPVMDLSNYIEKIIFLCIMSIIFSMILMQCYFFGALSSSNDNACQPVYSYDLFYKYHNTILCLACTSIFVVLKHPSSLLQLNTLVVDLS